VPKLRKPRSEIAFSSVLVLPLALGCTKKAFVVEVPHGFTGYVHVFCETALGSPAEPVQVNSLGGANAKSCPGGKADVTVLRDGKTVTATTMDWERSGDGTPVGLSFNVE
jgi:hypothetical protein